VTRVKILVADANKVHARRLAGTLGDDALFDVIGISNNCHEAFDKALEFMPDVLIYSANVAERDPDKLMRPPQFLRASLPSTKVMVLTEAENITECMYVLSLGARAYVSKHIAGESLMAMVSTVQAGGIAMSPVIVDKMINQLVASRQSKNTVAKVDHSQLTMREKEILELAARGKRNKEIANSLHITENTVKCHMSSILTKLGVCNRQSAAFVLSSTSLNS
jgi:DNA-binding NarL/FixJ family response regulator